QFAHRLAIEQENHTLFAAGKHKRRVRNQRDTARAHVDVLKEQILVVLGREPVDKLEGARCEFQDAAPEVCYSVIASARGGDINVPGAIARNAPASLPNPTLTSGGRTLKDR